MSSQSPVHSNHSFNDAKNAMSILTTGSACEAVTRQEDALLVRASVHRPDVAARGLADDVAARTYARRS